MMKRAQFKSWFDTFYNRTYSGALAYCMAKTGDFMNAEDLLADAYYAFYKQAAKSKGEIKEPDHYFFKILKNRISKYWKKHRKDLHFSEIEEHGIQYEDLLQTELDITPEMAMKRMLLQDILEYVSKLPAPMRRAFTMHFYLGKTIEETAAELSVSLPAARNYIYRTLNQIRENFLEEYE